MATTREEFQNLADELINDEFADFRKTLVITFGGGYDPVTESTSAGVSVTELAIRQKLSYFEMASNQGEAGNGDIQVTDFAAVYRPSSGVVPRVEMACVFDGAPCQIVDVQQDAADAAIKLILRGL